MQLLRKRALYLFYGDLTIGFEKKTNGNANGPAIKAAIIQNVVLALRIFATK